MTAIVDKKLETGVSKVLPASHAGDSGEFTNNFADKLIVETGHPRYQLQS